MKTLVVLSALVAATIAAPTLPELGFRPNQISETEDKLHLLRREKKSTEDLHDLSIHEQSDHEASETSARHFKKPIIIKKSKGHHHLYRDSDEEKANAESGETCRKEIKVKICDAASLDEKHNNQMTSDGDVHRSIKMAREAVENLQKDLQKLENWNVKSGKTERDHFDSGKDAEMHTDIEKARQALEHFQNNFETLESMQSNPSMMKDAEALEDAQRQLSELESETQRLTQWKEAMDNIKKNTEIARNIEDSFKSADVNVHEPLNLMKPEKVEHVGKHAEVAEKEMEVSASEHNEIIMNKNIATNQAILRSNVVSAGIQATHNFEKPNEELNFKHTEAELKKKDADELQNKISMKSSENNNHMSNKPVEKKLIEEHKSRSAMEGMKLMENEKTVHTENDKMRSDFEKQEKHEKLVENEKTAWHGKVKDDLLAKLSEKQEDKLNTDNLPHESDPSLKSVKKVNINSNEPTLAEKENDANKHIEMKTAEKTQLVEAEHQTKEMNNIHLKEAEHNDMDLSASNMKVHISESPMHSMELKEAAAEVKAESQNHEKAMRIEFNPKSEVASLSLVNTAHPMEKSANMEVAGPTNFQMKESSSKSLLDAHPIEKKIMALGKSANMELPGPTKFQMKDSSSKSLLDAHPIEKKIMGFGKSANMEVAGSTNFQMKESSSKSLLDQNSKWKPEQNQIASRGAYGLGGGYGAGAAAGAGAGSIIGAGSGGSGGPGAVGVFPNAKVGGCAIPLLLSCSPSVVSGSLAHSGSYGAPAYRAGEDNKFHKKRDTKKENKQITKIKRTPTRIIEKLPYAYDKQF